MMLRNDTNDVVCCVVDLSEGGQYIEKILGRNTNSPSYNDMGENKLEETIKFTNENNEKVEIETYYVDGVKVTVERVFIKNGKNMIDRLFDLFENDDLEVSTI